MKQCAIPGTRQCQHGGKAASVRFQRGSFIIESLVSVIIFAIGLISMIGLATQALNQVTQTKARNDASYLAGELVGDMWVSASAPSAFNTTPWVARVASALPSGQATVTVAGTQVDITITWSDSKNEGVRHQYQTTTQISRN
jgi:type IV pilus assembly protein PilV